MNPFTPNDAGPIYTETLLGHQLPVEPWNTFSNLIFLAILIHWYTKLRQPANRHRFLELCLPILLVGYVGGTIYHGTRSHDIWRWLDKGPIYVLLLGVAAYMWRRVLGSWKTAALVAAGVAVVSTALVVALFPDPSWAVTRGYIVLGISAVLPGVLYARKLQWQQGSWLLAAATVFLAALGFRQFDSSLTAFLPQGTHFLWHLCGGIASHCLVTYLFETRPVDVPLVVPVETQPDEVAVQEKSAV